MNKYLKYFAYGSNMHPLRIRERTPSAQIQGVGILEGYLLKFNKLGRDGSAKCHAEKTGKPLDRVWGVLYEIQAEERRFLDKAENLGKGYTLHSLKILKEGKYHPALVYLAQGNYRRDNLIPYDWYVEFLIRAGHYFRFPNDYLEALNHQKTQRDSQKERSQQQWKLATSL